MSALSTMPTALILCYYRYPRRCLPEIQLRLDDVPGHGSCGGWARQIDWPLVAHGEGLLYPASRRKRFGRGSRWLWRAVEEQLRRDTESGCCR